MRPLPGPGISLRRPMGKGPKPAAARPVAARQPMETGASRLHAVSLPVSVGTGPRAVAEAPDLREGYVECAQYFYQRQNWPGVLLMCESALAIRERSPDYINEAFAWGALPWDLAALAAWNLGAFGRALEYGEKAMALAPQNDRLKQNLAFYRRSSAANPPE